MSPASPRALRAWTFVVLAATFATADARGAGAQDAPLMRPAAEPAHYVATLAAGVPLRLSRNVDFDQGVLAPVYLDALGGYVLSSHAEVRHGVGVGLSLNLSEDGGFTEPVAAASQFVVMPSYLLYWTPTPALFGLGHLGLPILVSGGRSVGVEVGAGLGYRLLAGLGVYAEAALGAFLGAASTVHATASLEIGVFLDYEVLP